MGEQDVREAIIKAATEGRVSYSDAQAIIAEHRRATNKLIHAYGKRFGIVSGVQDRDLCRLYEAALRSGVDEPELVERKRKHKEYLVEYERKHAEFLATPITAETEQEYTGLIKNRKLYEGACELVWEQYSKYRDQHPDDCEPLTPDDLEYLALWTPCMAKRPPQDHEAVPPEDVAWPTPADPIDFEPIKSSAKANGATPEERGLRHFKMAFEDLEAAIDSVERIWPQVINRVGQDRFRALVSKLRAAYDDNCGTGAVKSAADRAESKAARKTH